MKEKLIQFYKLEEEIKDYFLPKVIKLIEDGKVNGDWRGIEIATNTHINSFGVNGNLISISGDVYMGWANYDDFEITLTEEEWANI